ncbi:hypothetical protein [Leptospira interrogans]|uniref:hypothetical protein n=1 Tax=Leptospira interrogans TaxID=173 RepID=UPI000AB56CFC|nr:hypothetical protein [Leptospira interrogans]
MRNNLGQNKSSLHSKPPNGIKVIFRFSPIGIQTDQILQCSTPNGIKVIFRIDLILQDFGGYVLNA